MTGVIKGWPFAAGMVHPLLPAALDCLSDLGLKSWVFVWQIMANLYAASVPLVAPLFHLGILLHFHHFREQNLIFASISVLYPVMAFHLREWSMEVLDSVAGGKRPFTTISCSYSKNNMKNRVNICYFCTTWKHERLNMKEASVFGSSTDFSGCLHIMIIFTPVALNLQLCFSQCAMPFNS